MVLSILLKVLFAIILNFVILRWFARKRDIVSMILQVVILLILCLVWELPVRNTPDEQQHLHLSHASVFWINVVIYLVILSLSFAIFFTR